MAVLFAWAVFIISGSLPLQAAPLVGDTFSMDAPVFLPADTVGQPSVATNGSNYLVVWQDRYAYGDIRGARLDLDGNLIDTEGFNISAAASAQTYPEVVAVGDHYLVVWQDRRSGYPDVYGARVSSSGAVMEKVGVPICVNGESQYFPAVGSDGEDAFVAWRDHRGKTLGFIHGAWIQWKEDGRWEIEEVPVGGEPCVADDTCTVYDQSCSETNGYCVSASGAGQDRPEVTSNGDNYLVSWHDSRTMWNYRDIYAAQISRDETEISVETNIAVHASYDISFSTAPVPTGDDYMVVWQQQNILAEPVEGKDLYAAVVENTDAGTVVGAATHLGDLPGTQGYPAAAWTGTGALITWNDSRTWGSDGAPEIYGARVSNSSTTLTVDEADFPIATFDAAYEKSTAGLGRSAVASTGGKSLVAWEKPRILGEGSEAKVVSDIYAGLVPSGTGGMDMSGFTEVLVGTSIERANDELHPAIAFDGINYLVVWQDSRTEEDVSYDIYGVRVRASDGEVLDDPAIAINTQPDDQLTPAVAYADGIFLVTWHDGNEGLVRAARVKAEDGSVLDPDGVDLISTDDRFQRLPVMATNGSSFAVIWQEGGDIHANSRDIQGARVIASEANGIALNALSISTGPRSQRAPSVATDGTDYLITWTDARNWATSGHDIYGARVAGSSGEVLDPEGFVITDAPRNQEEVSVVFGMSRYWAVWRAWNGAGEWEGHNIHGAAVLTSGTQAAVASSFYVDDYESAQLLPKISFDGSHLLVTWADNRKQQGKWDLYGKAVALLLGEGGTDFVGLEALSVAPDAKHANLLGEGNGRSFAAFQDNSSGANRIRANFIATSFGTQDPPDGEDAGGSEEVDAGSIGEADAGGSPEPEDTSVAEPDVPEEGDEDTHGGLDSGPTQADEGSEEPEDPRPDTSAQAMDDVTGHGGDAGVEAGGSGGSSGGSGCGLLGANAHPTQQIAWPLLIMLYYICTRRRTRHRLSSVA